MYVLHKQLVLMFAKKYMKATAVQTTVRRQYAKFLHCFQKQNSMFPHYENIVDMLFLYVNVIFCCVDMTL